MACTTKFLLEASTYTAIYTTNIGLFQVIEMRVLTVVVFGE